MATYMHRNGRVTATIRSTLRWGEKLSRSKTFGSLEEAQAWGESAEAQVKPATPFDQYILSEQAIYSLTRHPGDRATCGVYFLFEGNTCIYVGQSTNIHVRIRDHQNPGSARRSFDSYAFIEVPPDKLTAVEAHYITLMNPQFNITLNPGFKSRSSRC